MESIVSEALVVICTEGEDGCTISDLWRGIEPSVAKLGLHLCEGVKQSVWKRILGIPSIELKENGSPVSPRNISLSAAEKMGTRVVAPEQMRDACLGIYDLKASEAVITAKQRKVLERLAKCGITGIPQSELAKEFNINGNKLFYIVKNLECRGLLVRQSATVRTKESGSEVNMGNKTEAIVNTNLIHLSRYGKNFNLGSQQRFEIKKENSACNSHFDGETTWNHTNDARDGIREDMHVKDYLPAMRDICEKLEEATDKVLVVSDIKKELGYMKTSGHRMWRLVLKKLKEAQLVEEFSGEINKKVVSCLRLVKSFDRKGLLQKNAGYGYEELEGDQLVKCTKRGQITDQVLELPIDQQIYDVIDAEGSSGITVTEVCKKLGLSNKRNYHRFTTMVSRFGLHLQAESYKRSMAYRFWTSKNFIPVLRNLENGSSKIVHSGNMNIDIVTEKKQLVDECFLSRFEKSDCGDPFDRFNCDELVDEDKNELPTQIEECQVNDDGVDVRNVVESKVSGNISMVQADHGYPPLSLAAANAQRRQRILERLKDEKFLIVSELLRWLEDVEDKPTMLARKTLLRLLDKLEKEGQCKQMDVSVPALTNCGSSRVAKVILIPSVDMKPERLVQIHERLRSFDMESRGQGTARLKNEKPIPVLTGVRRTHVSSHSPLALVESMYANGYISAKMVRAKLFHTFLWGYMTRLPDWQAAAPCGRDISDIRDSQSSFLLFSLDAAAKAMPVELFLQVVGSTKRFEELVESCKHGLCLSELPIEEFKSLMTTHATARLSNLVDILRRLNLLRLVREGHEDGNMSSHAVLKYAVELKPYIEEPLQRSMPRFYVDHHDFKPKVRHDFEFSSGDAIDAYWKTLEYCYSAADPVSARHAFPGSAVSEVVNYRSWSSLRVMTSEQRAELLKRITNDQLDKRIPFKDCVKIARDLNLTLEQVLRVSYGKNRRLYLQNPQKTTSRLTDQQKSNPSKRKKISEDRLKSKVVSSVDNMLAKVRGTDTAENLVAFDSSLLANYDTSDHYEQEVFHSPVRACDVQPKILDDDTHGNIPKECLPEEDIVSANDFINQFGFAKIRPTRKLKFGWTEKADRQLLMQYARYRVTQGAKFHRVDWSSILDLPAAADCCRRRTASLKRDSSVRRAIMNLCNLLSERYAAVKGKHGSKDAGSAFGCGHSSSGVSGRTSCIPLETDDSNLRKTFWDDFEDPSIKAALDEVLQYRQRVDLDKSAEVRNDRGLFLTPQPHRGLSNMEDDSPASAHIDKLNYNVLKTMSDPHSIQHSETEFQGISCFKSISQASGGYHAHVSTASTPEKNKLSRMRHGKFLKHIPNRDDSIEKMVQNSLSVSNVVELIKLVFLHSSANTEVPRLLAETLRRYNEHDIFAAFRFLQEKNFVVAGRGTQPFTLSRMFLDSAGSSPFPTETGLKSQKFAQWLSERKSDLLGNGVRLGGDLGCGDMFHMFSLISFGKMVISPILPADGVGEVDDRVGLKRKIDKDKLSTGHHQSKKPKVKCMNDGELCSRREKGFPGIELSLKMTYLSKFEALELEISKGQLNVSISCPGSSNAVLPSAIDPIYETSRLPSSIGDENANSATQLSPELSWDAMCSFAKISSQTVCLDKEASMLCPDLFETAYHAINKSGDQGLTVEDVGLAIAVQGALIVNVIVDVLERFGLVVKVDAFDHSRVVATCHSEKYSLVASSANHGDYVFPVACGNENLPTHKEKDVVYHSEDLTSLNLSKGHRMTILHGSDIAVSAYDYAHRNSVMRSPDSIAFNQASVQGFDNFEECCVKVGKPKEFKPIVPWLNGDGEINDIMYQALVRRVLGVVMQNPGILEDDLIRQMDVLNPQSFRRLLELLVLDGHLFARKMHQMTAESIPTLLGSLFGNKLKKSESVYNTHYFANPKSTSLL